MHIIHTDEENQHMDIICVHWMNEYYDFSIGILKRRVSFVK